MKKIDLDLDIMVFKHSRTKWIFYFPNKISYAAFI